MDFYFLLSMITDEAKGPYVLQFQQTGDIGFLVVVKKEKQIYTYYKDKSMFGAVIYLSLLPFCSSVLHYID